jgi:hypothetical protein
MKLTIKHNGTEFVFDDVSYSHQYLIDLIKQIAEQIIKIQNETQEE